MQIFDTNIYRISKSKTLTFDLQQLLDDVN